MSLSELNNSTLYLVLNIKEGHGFGFLQNPIVIVASTCGLSLETEIIPPSPDPIFRTEFAWETDRKSIRGLRTSNTPIKVECFIVCASSQKREFVGSVLLNIRSAQVVPNRSHSKVYENWYKLVGVPADAKALQPELLMSLTMQDVSPELSPNDRGTDSLNQTMPEVAIPSNVYNTMSSSKENKSSEIIFKKKEGFVQLGPELSCQELFLLSFDFRNAVNFGLLPIPITDFLKGNDSNQLQILIHIFNQSVSSNLFGVLSDSSWHKLFAVNTSVGLHIRTSLSTLHMFLQSHPTVAIYLVFRGEKIATGKIHLRSLVPTDDIISFNREFGGESSIMQNCPLLLSEIENFSTSSETECLPFLQICTQLQLASSSVDRNSIKAENSDDVLSKKPFNTRLNSSLLMEKPASPAESRMSQDTFVVASSTEPKWVPVALSSSEPKLDTSMCARNIRQEIDEIRFVSSTTLTSRSGPSASPSRVALEEKNRNSKLIPLEARDSVPQSSLFPQSEAPPHLDSNIAYHMVKELEQWKDRQEELFNSQLERKETEYFARVNEEWTLRRKELEGELDSHMSHCKVLVQSLTDANKDLRNRAKRCAEAEQKFLKAKEELERQYNMKFHDLIIVAKKLDDGVKSKLSNAEVTCTELKQRLSTLQSENEKLQRQLREAHSNCSPDENPDGLNQNQVHKLLQQVEELEEKLQTTLKSKVYFKEQWGKAIRERNQNRVLSSQQIPEKLNVEDVLAEEEAELKKDKKSLDELRQKLANFASAR